MHSTSLTNRHALLLASALFAASFWPAEAANFTVYRYGHTNSNLSWSTTPSIGDVSYTASGFDIADDQATRISRILNSGYAFGHSDRTRGLDVSEDLEIDWTTPTIEANQPIIGRWLPLDGNGVYNNSFGTVLNFANSGPHAGEPLRGNPHAIAADSEHILFLDDDNTLSGYWLTSGAYDPGWDTSWTSLNGGEVLHGELLTWDLMENYFIGAEDNLLGFLTGPSTVAYYFRNSGNFSHSVNYSTATDGPLSQYTLADIIDNQAGGFRYVGLDTGPVIIGGIVAVPEPSVALLALGSVGFLTRRRRNA